MFDFRSETGAWAAGGHRQAGEIRDIAQAPGTSFTQSDPPDSCGKGTKRLLDRLPVLRIRITVMRIRIRLVTLIGIRILPFTLMRFRIRVRILSYKYRLKTLKKCSNRFIFHTFWLHLRIDANPDQLISLTMIRIRIRIQLFTLIRI